MRRIIWLFLAVLAVGGCQQLPPEYDSQYTPSRTATSSPVPAIAFIGDSYTAGTPVGGQREHGWPALLVTQLLAQGIEVRPQVAARRGAGYIKRGSSQNGAFIDQVQEVVDRSDRLVVIFGSPNDANAASDRLTAAVKGTISEVRRVAPGAKILAVGPVWTRPEPSPGVLQARDIVKAEATAASVTFVDPVADAWFINRPDLLGADAVNPTDAGHVFMAERLAPVIAQLLQAAS
ncbi:SGNH/GDSL hydrolase family protein [Mycolicibacterium austroafricanum]|uniref:SGNH/GDSL hydrolase family protein n=1 Tax=Mycolicibacterium austroafricanum TaxID=39687 RepID=UPI001CA37B78|nr:SGNH/GDSL hydrolase family protein [Mycolicibacterium austroafricanum]QZT58414.1 SGNH/GDSL hydrolase family protein [Mycolicibacterium austroafricanum]